MYEHLDNAVCMHRESMYESWKFGLDNGVAGCRWHYRSLRSTGERLSNLRSGSLRIVFQLPTPC